MNTDPITSFSGKYRFLSNFWRVNIVWEGHIYPSTENAYQAAKKHPSQRAQYRNCSPGESKRLSHIGEICPNWEFVKLSVMDDLLQLKFAPSSWCAEQLLLTDSRLLVEGNTWGDTFWGVCNGKGENHLGELLMKRRKALRQK